jgi:hypothetical protein
MPSVTISPARARFGRGDEAAEAGGVGDVVVGGQHGHHGVRIAPGEVQGGEADAGRGVAGAGFRHEPGGRAAGTMADGAGRGPRRRRP